MKAIVVETNVIAVANEMADHADMACVGACINALETAQDKRKIVIDSGQILFSEYFRYANRAGQPGLGDAFVKWLWDNQANVRHCERVDITSLNNDPGNFAEFPDDPNLQGFDRSDRKFVAVALAGRRKPKIINAVDTDWWHYKDELRNYGITIQFLCPDLMA